MESEYLFDHLAGELQPGDTGWLPLDASGVPSGPATISPPPGPDAKACSVSLTNGGHLVSSTGAHLDPPLNSNVDRRVGDTSQPEPVSLTSLNPTSAAMSDPDFTLECIGSGFTEQSVIVFNGGDEPIVFVNHSKITTIVKPSMVGTPVSVLVQVREGNHTTDGLPFEFTEATTPTRRR